MNSPGYYLNKYVYGGEVPGVPGNAPLGQNDTVAWDPTTGTYVDKNTGAHYTQDPYGQNGGPAAEVKAPTLADQAGTAGARATSFLNDAAGYRTREAAAYGQEGQLAASLQGQVNGTAPSIARMNAEQTAQDVAAQQQAMAAGASGANGALGRMAAMRNTERGQVAAQNAGTIGHVQEVQGAQANLGNLLSGMAGQSAGLYGADVGAGETFSGQAGNFEGTREGAQNDINKTNAANDSSATKDLFSKGSSALQFLAMA